LQYYLFCLFTILGKRFAHEKSSDRQWKRRRATERSRVGILSHKYDLIVSARRCTMKKIKIAIAIICLLCATVATVLASEAATIFTGAIVGIDETQRTITLQTRDGQIWTLPVTDSNILKQEQVAKGDLVNIEIDLSYRVTKITNLSELPPFERTQSFGTVQP
jgi:hypothetical protein